MIKQKLLNLIKEYPDDYIVIANRWNSDFKVSIPCTYLKDAKKEYYNMLNLIDIDFKVNIFKLNKNSLKEFLR